jgi:hypothetical protein
MTHTKEPWVQGNEWQCIAMCGSDYADCNSPATAHSIAAAMNALAGLNPDALAGLIEEFERSQALLKVLLPNWSDETRAQIKANEAALANIRGEA